jgi:glycine cleavage system H protein
MKILPQDCQYTRDDIWLRAEGNGLYTLGLTDFGQNELGELVYVELPAPDYPVQIGQSVAVVESVKSVSEVRCPVSGTVVEANARVGESPTLVNESPYEEGWIARLRVEEAPENLLSPQQYAQWRRLDES